MKSVVSVSFFILLLNILPAQTDYPQPSQVNGNLYSVALDGCNAAFLVTDSGVVVVDAGISPIDGWDLKSSIASVTDKKVKYIILTHHHFDHIGGVQVFLPEARLIAAKGVYESMLTTGKKISDDFLAEMEAGFSVYKERSEKLIATFTSGGELQKSDSIRANIQYYRSYIDSCKAVRIFKPDIEFKKSYTLKFGGYTVQLQHPGPAHTGSDCIVYFPAYSTAHIGDLYFEKSFPYIDGLSGASVKNWMKILKKLSGERKVMFLLCGHGHITHRLDLLTMRQLFLDMQNEVAASIKQGLSADETVKNIKLEKYKDYLGRDLMEKGIKLIYEQREN